MNCLGGKSGFLADWTDILASLRWISWFGVAFVSFVLPVISFLFHFQILQMMEVIIYYSFVLILGRLN